MADGFDKRCLRAYGLPFAELGNKSAHADPLAFGADGRISGSASCNQYSGSYALDRGALSFTSALVATQRACAPSLMDQERRFLAILGAARRIELLPTGALLLSTPEGKALRFFPEQPVKPAAAPMLEH